MSKLEHQSSRWCILRTAGRSTLPLADSLSAAGIDAWAPRQTLRRPVPGSKPGKNGRRPTQDIDAPILPTFVFASATCLPALAATVADPTNQHPAFSIMHYAGRVPLVAHADVAGLRDAEQTAIRMIADLRAADDREAQRQVRAAAMKTERERRKAMRAEVRHFDQGQFVAVSDAPALVGMTGVIESSDGREAIVSFGGFLTMKIDSWRLSPNAIQPPRP